MNLKRGSGPGRSAHSRDFEKNRQYLLQKKAAPEKRERISEDHLRRMLFTLFEERSPYWSLKALVDETDQPEAYLRNILSTVAVIVKRGSHRNEFILRREFRSTDIMQRMKEDELRERDELNQREGRSRGSAYLDDESGGQGGELMIDHFLQGSTGALGNAKHMMKEYNTIRYASKEKKDEDEIEFFFDDDDEVEDL
ncbi:putative transcription initiation factor TFIIF subunit beta [Blattamonas nauphoetae]|uniref:Transcription initiation factor TFIIF subunit beta n=1 Tax=Blattamonas nauphoetae TaxID=2049346 RepID=A0ABQ9YFH7_9EUKA|nr:putative transcription initiation factor TFIIF subunit beta [Blattamonas nauphoetae]